MGFGFVTERILAKKKNSFSKQTIYQPPQISTMKDMSPIHLPKSHKTKSQLTKSHNNENNWNKCHLGKKPFGQK